MTKDGLTYWRHSPRGFRNEYTIYEVDMGEVDITQERRRA